MHPVRIPNLKCCGGSNRAPFQSSASRITKFAHYQTSINDKTTTVVTNFRKFSYNTTPKSYRFLHRLHQGKSWNKKHSSTVASSILASFIFSMSSSNITPYKWSTTNPCIVETSWLAEQLKNPNSKVKIFDCSWTLQESGLYSQYLKDHIPSALFFDIDKVADITIPLPHMLPSSEEFAQHMDAFGISNDNHVVLYDRSGSYIASARAWWTFNVFGHKQVSVLEGGLPKWIQEGYPVESGEPKLKPSSGYKTTFNPSKVASLQQMLVNIKQNKQMIDARPIGRFEGVDPEPRPNLRGGHIPGSRCIPWATVLHKRKEDDPWTVFLPPEELSQVYKKEGINPNEPVVTTCGSGVTASVLSLGLYLLGNNKSSLYDGAYAEWGKESLADVTPVEKGKSK